MMIECIILVLTGVGAWTIGYEVTTWCYNEIKKIRQRKKLRKWLKSVEPSRKTQEAMFSKDLYKKERDTTYDPDIDYLS